MCEKKWADTKVDGFVFTCKGCTEVAGGFGARSERSAADGGGHEGDGCRTEV